MKKRILIVLCALPLLILGLIASISFYAVNINSSPTTKQSVAAEPVVIYDKNGNQVPSFDATSQELISENASLKQPTTVKRRNNGQSNNFSGSGMYYGGDLFATTGNPNNIRFSVNKGAFAIYITNRPAPSSLVQYLAAVPSRSFYHTAWHNWLYFGAYNPISGQNYFIQAH
ncbi:hypothetical protein [Lactiplantibacillus pentosus]|jgi:hypothetical protein|nr:hypothetical protein [Lactiplantibacillus pentosus]MCJ8180163.1 hypothetical protein [Lactiplantibacillus pentosus]